MLCIGNLSRRFISIPFHMRTNMAFRRHVIFRLIHAIFIEKTAITHIDNWLMFGAIISQNTGQKSQRTTVCELIPCWQFLVVFLVFHLTKRRELPINLLLKTWQRLYISRLESKMLTHGVVDKNLSNARIYVEKIVFNKSSGSFNIRNRLMFGFDGRKRFAQQS